MPIAASLFADRFEPNGDTAFIAAVAAFGQRLRGDPHLGKFGYADSARLAEKSGTVRDYWRREFVTLANTADKVSPAAAAGHH